MPSTYTNNLRLEEIATGEKSGTWGDITNTNLEIIASAMGSGLITLAADADETFTMADGANDELRSMYLSVESAVSLTATRIVTLAPNTVSKVWFIKNNTTGGQSITIKQGSGSTITIGNGNLKIVVTDGAGSTSAVTDALDGISYTDLAIGNDINMISDAAQITFGADSEIQLTHVADSGLLLTETGGGTPELQIRDSALNIGSSADGQLDINADTKIALTSTDTDVNGNFTVIDGDGTVSNTTTTASLTIDGTSSVGSAFVQAKLNIGTTNGRSSRINFGGNVEDDGFINYYNNGGTMMFSVNAGQDIFSIEQGDGTTGIVYVGNAVVQGDGGGSWESHLRINSNTGAAPSSTNTGASFEYNVSTAMSELYSAAGSVSSRNHAFFINPNGTVGSITTSASATAFNTSSDYRLKQDVEYNWNATEKLLQLKPATFAFKADPSTRIEGFMAHELQEHSPNAVTGEKDGEEMQSVDHSKLVPLLVKTVQELEARIAELENARS